VNNLGNPSIAGCPVKLFVNSGTVMGVLNIFQDGSMILASDLNGSNFTSGQLVGFGTGGFTAMYT
jgi:hypothetical protein